MRRHNPWVFQQNLEAEALRWLQPEAIVQLGIWDTSAHLKPQIHSDLFSVSQSAGVMLFKWEQCTVWAHLVDCSTRENILDVSDTANIKINNFNIFLVISNLLKHPNSCCYRHVLASAIGKELASFNVENVVRVLDVFLDTSLGVDKPCVDREGRGCWNIFCFHPYIFMR